MSISNGVLKNNCIGLTGGIACGKSTIGIYLRKLGYTVIDADVLARQAVEAGSDALVAISDTFGSQHIKEDGSLDRQMLRATVFNDYSKLDLLEKIISPCIHSLLLQSMPSDQIWFYEAAILLKFYKAEDLKEVWYATCPSDIQLKRLMNRDKISEDLALKMIARQHFDHSNCTIIDTHREPSSLEELISEQLTRVKATSSGDLQIV